jgi:squalene-associated FAD-dependent desaturase
MDEAPGVMTAPRSHIASAAIVGGGLAGLAAACALAESGLRVTLFERRPYLGGRASSYHHPGTGEIVDNCQHVLFGSCTNLIAFYQRIGVSDQVGWSDRMTFVEPGGRQSILRASWLPAPLHTAPAFLEFPFLDWTDKLAIARALAALIPSPLPDTSESFQAWLARHGQTENSIQRFWKPILVSALSEDLDRISVRYAAQVVRESMKSPAAGHMGIPRVPLTGLYNAAADYITSRSGEIQLRCKVESFQSEDNRVTLTFADGSAAFDFLVMAVPYNALPSMLPEQPASQPLQEKLARFESSPITGIHLWFDRQITDLAHAVLLDRTIQWMFHKSKLLARNAEPGGSYIELVVSASHDLVEKSREEIVELARNELAEFFPAARSATLLKSAVIKEVHATYSPKPGIEALRPLTNTAWPRVFLAGDWIATGWPATMESAVRSGYQAAESVARAAGIGNVTFRVPDLPASGLMRLLG